METSYLIKLLKEISNIMAENKDKLIEMDGIVGDGDLGLTMSDGFKAAYDAVSDGAIADAGKLMQQKKDSKLLQQCQQFMDVLQQEEKHPEVWKIQELKQHL